MVSIAAHTKADDFSINFCTAFAGMFVLFQHHNSGTVTKYETITIFIPRAACGLRIIVARG